MKVRLFPITAVPRPFENSWPITKLSVCPAFVTVTVSLASVQVFIVVKVVVCKVNFRQAVSDDNAKIACLVCIEQKSLSVNGELTAKLFVCLEIRVVKHIL
jgi:hypothetical protein